MQEGLLRTRRRVLDISSTDLNNLKTSGDYDGASLTNSPDGTTAWFYVEVLRHSTDNLWVMQRARLLGTEEMVWVRLLLNGTWGSWYIQPSLYSARQWAAQQYMAVTTLTDAATIAWAAANAQKAKVTLGGSRTMGAVTGAVEGATYLLWVIQDATGSRTITWTTSGAGSFDFGTDGAPTLTTTASKADLLEFEALSIGGTLKLRMKKITKGFA